MRLAMTLVLGILLMATASGGRGQAQPAAQPGPSKPSPQTANTTAQAPKAAPPQGTAAASVGKKAGQSPRKGRKAAATKPAAKKPARAVKPTETAANTQPPKETEGKVARRDPFESLVGRQRAAEAAAKNLPPGKAGLQVSTLRLDGVVKAPNGMIAVVSNPQSRTYFLREGDQLYDGRVEKIAMDGVSFHEIGKDAFGKPVERQVNKRIYPSAGEQQ